MAWRPPLPSARWHATCDQKGRGEKEVRVVGALPGSGSQVYFQLQDALMPEMDWILQEITPELLVAGEIMFLSDHAEEKGRFAIVGLGGTMSPLIVPTDRLHLIMLDG